MCRIVGIMVNKDDVRDLLITAVSAQNFAGEESCGLAAEEGNKISIYKGIGVVTNVFAEIAEERVLLGHKGLGHNACHTGDIQPVTVRIDGKEISLSIEGTKRAVQRIIDIIDGHQNIEKAIQRAMLEVDEFFALVALYPDGLIGARSAGRMPLSFGQIVFKKETAGSYFASQSGILGSNSVYRQTIEPGHMAVLHEANGTIENIAVMPPDINVERCIMELLFMQRPGNILGGREVNDSRSIIGRKMGEKFLQHWSADSTKNCIVLPIPLGGRSYASGFAKATGIPCDPAAITKTLYQKQKWFPTNFDLHLAGEEVVDGHVVNRLVNGGQFFLVDDLIRSGDKIAHMAKECYRAGAKEVHGVVAGMLKSSCHYGKGSYVFDQPLADRTAQSLGLASLTILNVPELIKAVQTPHRLYCTECLKS